MGNFSIANAGFSGFWGVKIWFFLKPTPFAVSIFGLTLLGCLLSSF
jgi:hypothetical protein